jgi:membrane protein YdbS with pleckstrin-like domain
VAFPPKLLNDGEEIVLDLRPHWWFFIGPATAVIGLIVLTLAVRGTDWLVIPSGVGLLVVAVWLLHRYARWISTNFVVTTSRLIYRHGMLSKKGIEIPLDRVNTIFFNQSILERLLGAGDLVIESAGERGRQHFTDIRKPALVQNIIYRQMEEYEERRSGRVARAGGGDGGGSGSSGGSVGDRQLSIPEQIEKLDDLRRRGALSDAEFEAKKRQLLDRM